MTQLLLRINACPNISLRIPRNRENVLPQMYLQCNAYSVELLSSPVETCSLQSSFMPTAGRFSHLTVGRGFGKRIWNRSGWGGRYQNSEGQAALRYRALIVHDRLRLILYKT